MFANPPGPLRVELHSEGLRDRIGWGSGSDATAVGAAGMDMNLQCSTLRNDESGRPLHVQQAEQIRAYRQAWKEVGHIREARRHDRPAGRQHPDRFGRGYAAKPDALVRQLAADEAIAEADTLLFTLPNQLGVEYCAHVIESILTHVAPALGWREDKTTVASAQRKPQRSLPRFQRIEKCFQPRRHEAPRRINGVDKQLR